MYDFVDRPVTSLDHGGRFLVWSMRSWVKSIHEGRCPCTGIGPAFSKWRMFAGLPHFQMMMLIFNRDAKETFSFGSLDCNRVREHEALILALVSAMRTGCGETVRATLALMVKEDAIIALMTAVAALSRTMADANIFPGTPTSLPQVKDCPNE
jgi:hypothetical protein